MAESDGQMQAHEIKDWKRLLPYGLLQKHGTSLMQGMNGTLNMESKLPKKCQSDRENLLSANNAEPCSRFIQPPQEEQDFAPASVRQSIDGTTALTTKQELALFAGKSFVATSILNKKLVLESAELNAWCWKEKKEPVFNLTVEGTHEYFANGVLVHNCTDALGYACLSRPWAPTVKRPPKKIDRWERHKHSKARSAWTY